MGANRPNRIQTWGMVCGFALLLFLLACVCGGGGMVGTPAAPVETWWACPSPPPMPYGPTGPVKDTRYFAEWEQECGEGLWWDTCDIAQDPPFPDPVPLPYGSAGPSYETYFAEWQRECIEQERSALCDPDADGPPYDPPDPLWWWCAEHVSDSYCRWASEDPNDDGRPNGTHCKWEDWPDGCLDSDGDGDEDWDDACENDPDPDCTADAWDDYEWQCRFHYDDCDPDADGPPFPSPTPLAYGESGPPKSIERYAKWQWECEEMYDSCPVDDVPFPSPTPRPFGSSGPVKETLYFAEWEQECISVYDGCDPDADGPPFPSPTPYVQYDGPWSRGQMVNVVDGLSVYPKLEATSVTTNGLRLYMVDIQWANMTTSAYSLTATTARLHTTVPYTNLGSVVLSDTLVVSGETLLDDPAGAATEVLSNAAIISDTWMVSEASMAASGAPLPTTLGRYEQRTRFPILAPDGAPTHFSIWLAVGQDLVVLVFADAPLDPPCSSPGLFGQTPKPPPRLALWRSLPLAGVLLLAALPMALLTFRREVRR